MTAENPYFKKPDNERKLVEYGQTALDLCRTILQTYPSIDQLQFSRYSFTHPASNVDNGSHEDYPFWINGKDFFSDAERLKEEERRLLPGFNIALDSEVTMKDGSHKYIPLMDASLEKSDVNLVALHAAVTQRIQPKFGNIAILESTSSYHLIGLSLLDFPDQIAFLGTCLNTKIAGDNGKVKRLGDVGFVSYVLEQKGGSSSLRITGDMGRNIPQVVSMVTGK